MCITRCLTYGLTDRQTDIGTARSTPLAYYPPSALPPGTSLLRPQTARPHLSRRRSRKASVAPLSAKPFYQPPRAPHLSPTSRPPSPPSALSRSRALSLCCGGAGGCTSCSGIPSPGPPVHFLRSRRAPQCPPPRRPDGLSPRSRRRATHNVR